MFRRIVPMLAVCVAVVASGGPVQAADISSAMTADFLTQCQRSQETCREFANNVLQVLNAGVSLGQARTYKGCAPYPLSLDDTGKLVGRILARPQEATGYAADDIGNAAQALWPCK